MSPIQERKQYALLTSAHRDYEKGLSTHAFFKLRDSTMSQDLVQDTFIKTWSYLAKGGKIETMKAFLYHVLNCLIIDEYRKKKNISLEILAEKGFEPCFEESSSLFDRLDCEGVMLLITRLPKTYQKVMRMRYVQDLSLAEMSLATGLSKNAMAVQVHRGLEKMKVLYRVGDGNYLDARSHTAAQKHPPRAGVFALRNLNGLPVTYSPLQRHI